MPDLWNGLAGEEALGEMPGGDGAGDETCEPRVGAPGKAPEDPEDHEYKDCIPRVHVVGHQVPAHVAAEELEGEEDDDEPVEQAYGQVP